MASMLHINIDGAFQALDHEHVTLNCSIVVGFSDRPHIVDSLTVETPLRENGTFKTSLEIAQHVLESVNTTLLPMHSLPANSFDAVHITGAYGHHIIT